MVYRQVEMLVPELREKYFQFHSHMMTIGIPYILTCTARELKDQVALYAQGRQPLEEVNDLRRIAHLPPITDAQNKKVTWTLKSKHLINLDDKDPNNNLAKAFDIAIISNGKPTWDLKCDVNKDAESDYMTAGKIGESIGLIWGGHFKSPDYPHFQL